MSGGLHWVAENGYPFFNKEVGSMAQFDSFDDFYRHYLRLHRREGTRAMHFSGLLAFFICLLAAVVTRSFGYFVLAVILGYAPAIASHFIYEKNKPATLQNPIYSLFADFRMFFDLLRGKESFFGGAEQPPKT